MHNKVTFNLPRRIQRISIGRRLTLCFVIIILVMLGGAGPLLWQFHLVHAQAERLSSVDQELIAVLRFQTSLWSFNSRLNELAQSEDASRFSSEFKILRAAL